MGYAKNNSVFTRRKVQLLLSQLLIIILGLFFTSTGMANVSVTGSSQSPVNDVPVGTSVSYDIIVSAGDNSAVNFRILQDGQAITSSFTSTAGGCELDIDTFFCDQQPVESQETYSFNWTPPAAGTYNLLFEVTCDPQFSEICAGLGSPEITTVVVDSQPGLLQFSTTDYQANEGDTATITVIRVGGSTGVETVEVLIGDDSDTAVAADYTTPASTILTFADGVVSQTLDIPLLSDVLVEGDEFISLQLSPVNQNVGTPANAILTITDTTTPGVLQFSTDSYQVTEDNTATITVNRIGGSDGTIVTDIIIGDEGDTATAADYTPPASTRLSFADGVTSQTLDIVVPDDASVEGDETLSLALISINGSVIGTPSSSVLTISDPQLIETGELNFSAASYNVSEQDTEALITVTRTGGSIGALDVDIQIGASGDTADTTDYTSPASNRLSWIDGDITDKTITIPITADQVVEDDEVLTLTLIAVNDAPLGNISQSVLTISDNPPDVDSVGIVSGNLQSGTIGTVLDPFVISVTDASGNPVVNTSIDWEVTPATGGTLASATTVTDADGNSSNILTLNSDDLVVVTARSASPDVDPTIFQINPRLSERTGLNENQQSIAEALDIACLALENSEEELTFAQQDLLATCDRLDASENLGAELDLLIPDEVSSQGTAVIKAANLQVMNINSRLNALRSGASGFSLSGLGVQVEGVTIPKVVLNQLANGEARGGAAGDNGMTNRWGGFINGNISFGTKDRTVNENGFDFDTRGITAGLDYRVANDLIVGAAVGFGSNESDFESQTGDMEMDGWHLTGYGTYYRDQRMYLDGVIKLGFNSFDTTRRVSPTGAPLQNALADTDGKEISMSFGGGYEIARNATTIGGYGRIGYTKADIDAYSETAQFAGVAGAGSMLSIDAQDVDSLTTTLGAEVSYSISTAKGVFIPQARLEWEHEFSDDKRDIEAQFLADPTSTTFGITTDDADSDYFNLGLGFSAVTSGGKSGFLYYETRIGQDDLEQHWIKGGFRFEF